MANMKKHLFLEVEWLSTIKLSATEQRELKVWLNLASEVLEDLIHKNKLIKSTPKKVIVSLLVCGDGRIKKLNRDFRQKDKITDVLSFPTYENLRSSKINDDELFLGDLAICYQQTKRQAKDFSIGFWDEFIHLFFHGLIHLMGYDHEISIKEEKMMESWEKKALTLMSKKNGARRPHS